MIKRKISVSAVIAFVAYLFIGGMLIINFPDIGYSIAEKELYTALLIAYFVVVGLVAFAIANFDLYLFEPFSIITLLYIGIFIFRPIQDLMAHNVAYAGKSYVVPGTKSTVLFIIGFVAFYIGYFIKKRQSSEVRLLYRIEHEQDVVPLLVGMWSVFFIACLICQFSQGMSLRYIFSFGSSGEREVNGNNSLLLFLSNFATSLLTVWLMILVKSRNTVLKIVLTALTAVYLIMRNSRWLVLIMILSPITYFYAKRKKAPKTLYIGLIGLMALIVFAWMQLNRYNIAMGREVVGFGENGLTLGVLMSPFDSDLTTYTTFYGMVQNYPTVYPYMKGQTFLYLFVLFVPRILWPGKPDNPVRDMIEHSLGSLARMNGRAVSNIGEYYANFGIIGIIVLMFLFGFIVSHLKKLYEQPTEDSLIMYSVLFPLMFQWAARGNFSSNFYYTLFAFVPLFIISAVQFTVRRKQ